MGDRADQLDGTLLVGARRLVAILAPPRRIIILTHHTYLRPFTQLGMAHHRSKAVTAAAVVTADSPGGRQEGSLQAHGRAANSRPGVPEISHLLIEIKTSSM